MNARSKKSLNQASGRRIADCAFTLVELLVTLVVLAVLMALLSGGIIRAGNLAQNSKCVSNLRTVGAGALQFMNDQGGTLLPSKSYTNPSFRLDKPGFRDYVGIVSSNIKVSAEEFHVDSAFTCPVILKEYPAIRNTYLRRCYLSNYYAYKDDPENLDESVQNQKPPSPSFASRLANIASPSRMWMFSDGWVNRTTGSISSYAKRANAAPSSTTYRMDFHSDRLNVVFFDGHVEPLAKSDFYDRSQKYFWGVMDALN